MCLVTVSELLVGVERANTPERKARRGAFVEHSLSLIRVLEFSLPVAQTHARMLAVLRDLQTQWLLSRLHCRATPFSGQCSDLNYK